jgi:dephospho-CoA kinase
VPVVSADALAREVVLPGAPALEELAEAFGPRILQPDGTLDRAQLGALTLGHPERRALLNSILHPKIRQGAEGARGAGGGRGPPGRAYVLSSS